MADDDDVIYVDVAARLDENSAERATGRLRDKFKDAGGKIGDAFGSAFSRNAADTLSNETDRIGNALQDSADRIGDKFGSEFAHKTADQLDKILGKGVFPDLQKSLSDSLKNLDLG